MDRFYAILWCLCLTATVRAIPRALLYDYKGSEVSQLPRGDDVSSPPVPLKVPVVLYRTPYESVYVSAEEHCIGVNGVNCRAGSATEFFFNYNRGYHV